MKSSFKDDMLTVENNETIMKCHIDFKDFNCLFFFLFFEKYNLKPSVNQRELSSRQQLIK